LRPHRTTIRASQNIAAWFSKFSIGWSPRPARERIGGTAEMEADMTVMHDEQLGCTVALVDRILRHDLFQLSEPVDAIQLAAIVGDAVVHTIDPSLPVEQAALFVFEVIKAVIILRESAEARWRN
jgi:hypothetical protein